MRVLIQAVEREGKPARWRAGRRWPCEQPVEVEVLDTESDPPEIETQTVEASSGRLVKIKVPDPARIGRKSYEAIKADPMLRIVQDQETHNAATSAAISAAQAEAGRLGSELAAARGRVAELEANEKGILDKLDQAAAGAEEAAKVEAGLRAELAKTQAALAQAGEANAKLRAELAELHAALDAKTAPAKDQAPPARNEQATTPARK